MSDYLNIASALHTENLTLFIGTGFSKFITNNNAPSWLELLVLAANHIDKKGDLSNQLFQYDKDGEVIDSNFELIICAQIIELEYKKRRLNLKEKIAEIIKDKININTIDFNKINYFKDFFSRHQNINIITTNYDTIFSEYILPNNSRLIIEGSIISRLNNKNNIYHIHGSITKPESIVLTMNDYYNFQNSNNYFSKKFYTILQETTVLILGYSLGDFNLNTILNEVKNTKKLSFRKSDTYYISRKNLKNVVQNFYSSTYGIKVIEFEDLTHLFKKVESEYIEAKNLIENLDYINNALSKTHIYTDDYISLQRSFPTILLQASELGIDNNDKNFINLIISILYQKKKLTTNKNAWSQYEHLASWLIDCLCIINLSEIENKTQFDELISYSIKKSSKDWYFGYSWYSWWEWKNRWHEMHIENQIHIQDYIKNNNYQFNKVNAIDELF